MKFDVFDTYVTREDGQRMHFDVFLPAGGSKDTAKQFAMKWLAEMKISTDNIQLDSCEYCHSEQATPEVAQALETQGYAILQMQGCPSPIF